ncbi:hypothetical protein [Sinorhizobium medicae]|uniref:hypothetical protein n=1 Tax=Sinorhizobium medicae TaxID=110321 RepID=UPI003088431C|nr:hypothetical protein U8C38_18355 [Sinorhizobium medicae]
MDLLKLARATKVLVLAFALAMPTGLSARAESGGVGNAETGTRHMRGKHRTSHHIWHKGRHRSVTTVDGFSSSAFRSPPDFQTRTRHVRPRTPWSRFPWHRHARRGRDHRPVVIIGGGEHSFGGDGGHGNHDFPTPISDIGTYAGGLSAYRDEGNGIYFSRDGGYSYLAGDTIVRNTSSKRAKIIILSPQVNASACSWERGVCVVRP